MNAMHDDIELSIVLPCLNESRTLSLCLEKAQAFLKHYDIKGEIVVADNGSSDNSVALARQGGAEVVVVQERGYGAALAGGIAVAKGHYVIMADADDSYDLSDPILILKELRKGYQMVVGNRFKGGIKKGAMPWLNRYIGNPVLSAIGRIFFRIPVGDFHCGIRGFERDAILKLDLRTTGMEYASEMIVRAALYNLKITEVPTILSPDGRHGKSHLNPWRDGWRHLRFLLLYSPRWLYLYPGVALIIVGLVVSAFLLPGPLRLPGKVAIDVHTLLIAAMAVLAGIQTLTFGLLARTYAIKNGLFPETARYKGFFMAVTMERLLIGGAFMILAGICCIVTAVEIWSGKGFGPLVYSDVMRLMIVGVTSFVGGLHLGLIGFIFGIMNIRHKT